MDREQVMRMLTHYKHCAARRECLRMEIPQARRQLELAREQALAEAALPGRAPDAPRGGGTGDPTAGVAVRFASGYQPAYIRSMACDVERLQDELRECDAVCRYVDVWRSALSGRERLVIDRHVIGGESYAQTIEALNEAFPADPVSSPDGMKCLNRRALAKVMAAAGCG